MNGDQFKIRIAEVQDFSVKTIQYLEEFASVEVGPCAQNDLKKIFEEVDVFWFRLGYVINDAVVSSQSRVKAIVTPVTGIDHIDEEVCRQNNIKIICLRGEYEFLKSIRATAEHTIGLTLSLLRNIVTASNSVKNGVWNRDLFRGYELYNKKVGILGYGRLGEIVAKYFLAFNCKVYVYDVKDLQIAPGSEISMVDSIEELFSVSDILSIHVNYTLENYHLVNGRLIDMMSPDSVIINTSRGGIMEEEALLTALKMNRIKGAAIDVVQDESHFNSNAPIIEYAALNNHLLITPHIGGNTYESFEKTEFFLAEKVKILLNELNENTRNYTG